MGNGSIGPFRGDPDDPEVLKQEARNEDTIRRYYKRVYNGQDVDAIDDLVTETFKIHRNREVRKTRASLKAMVKETLANFFDLRVELEDIVAMRGDVAVRLNVWHKPRVGPHADKWMRIRGVQLAKVRDGRITETSVSYLAQEEVPADEVERHLPPA